MREVQDLMSKVQDFMSKVQDLTREVQDLTREVQFRTGGKFSSGLDEESSVQDLMRGKCRT